MAFELPVSTLPGILAGADLSSSQFLIMKLDGSGKAVAAGAGERAIGVLQGKPAADEAAGVWGAGSTSKVVSGAALTAGDALAADASGKAVLATSGDYIIGECVEGTGAADELATIYLSMPGRVA